MNQWILGNTPGRGNGREPEGVPPAFLRGAFPRIPRKTTATRFRLTPVTERPHHYRSFVLHCHVLWIRNESFKAISYLLGYSRDLVRKMWSLVCTAPSIRRNSRGSIKYSNTEKRKRVGIVRGDCTVTRNSHPLVARAGSTPLRFNSCQYCEYNHMVQ